jgi:hypothetical protein
MAPQYGAEKQDCERSAAKRWLAKHGPALARYRPIYLGNDLSARQPIATAIQNCGGNFILTCKHSSHKTIAEYLTGAELQEHGQTVIQSGKRSIHIYRGLARCAAARQRGCHQRELVLRRDLRRQGKTNLLQQLHHRPADLPITAETVAEPAACGRARWKIENETFNGHGKQTLASVLVTLNLLAFALHTVSQLCVLAWRTALAARGPRYRFFEHLRTIAAYIVFNDWTYLLQSIADPKARPP